MVRATFSPTAWTELSLSMPDPKMIGTNRLDVLVNGRPIAHEIRDAVQTSGEAVLYYDFPRAGETTALPKVSYATEYPAWTFFGHGRLHRRS